MEKKPANTEKLIEAIEANDYDSFFIEWDKIKISITEKEKQLLLVEIVDEHYSDSKFSFFKKVLDKIIDKKLNLNFNIDHWAPSFLSLSILKFSKTLFLYLIENHASINYISDRYAFEDEVTKNEEAEYYERFYTCLDFAKLQSADMFIVDFTFCPPDWEKINKLINETENETISVLKQDYLDLAEQAQYLHDVRELDNIIDEIKSLGGKTIDELDDDSIQKTSNIFFNSKKQDDPKF